MEQLRILTEQAIQNHPAIATQLSPPESTTDCNTPWQAPRDENCRTTRSRTHATATQRVPRVNTQVSPRVEKPHAPPPSTTARAKKRRRRRAAHQLENADAPACNTRSQVRRAAEPTAQGTRQSTKTQTRLARLMRPTVSSQRKSQPENTFSATKQSQVRRVIDHIHDLENEVHQAMAVMDAETGKLLNYKKLMRDPKYKKRWSVSSANEFG